MVANKVGRYWLTRLENHAQHQHVRFVPPSEHELRAEYELIWIFQGYVSEQLGLSLFELMPLSASTKCICAEK